MTLGKYNWLIIGGIRQKTGRDAEIYAYYHELLEKPAKSFMVRTRGKDVLLFVEDEFVGGMTLQVWPNRAAALFSTSLGRDLASFRNVRIRWPVTDEDMRASNGGLAKALRRFDRR